MTSAVRPRGLVVPGLAVLSVALGVLLPAVSAGASDEASWSVRPRDGSAVLEHVLRAGDEVDDAVVVRNEGGRTLELAVSASDTRAGADGALEVADTRTGPAAWVSVPVEPVTLAAGEDVGVPVHVVVPPDAAPGTYVAAVVTTAPDEQGGLAVERRLALRVVLTVEAPGASDAGPWGLVVGALVVGAFAAVAAGAVVVLRRRRDVPHSVE
ncbi:hypothetical protein CWIS_09240 [Cellulomonas sp. A375-1]|uniref:hypothetical protein n=1 Tax=Cellulomonas sp. A375-1 TaxID=1672219 RepID=UPI0006527271|nr:hypothetical protein [Cellulomonas sp. A375-1]KMM45740.1 hypothetical protein CWIS_09240 [Cellulomonas sp. A375-1]